ncbi:N-formylglutamate amidohydrolase [Azospirillum halopraeferens]|uniref:N-formylglutamate amidohydrolase n=1 Tax=Azospirillum halopraeferens TaxID=34010 RepID=UPI0012EB5EB4|nr:N-formylglutamate amidohydrolase [Azospirillum halopraeferens]
MTPPSPCCPARPLHPSSGPVPARAAPRPLIGPDDPPPATVLNPGGAAAMVLVCDHAHRTIPRALGSLGLSEEQLRRHIAYDIGAADVTRHLAERFDAPAVLAGYSRLVIDPNRALEDPTAVPVVSDDVVIPGNRALDAEDVRRRVDAFFTPYQATVAATVAAKREQGVVPAFVSVHSFTPEMRGVARPWHVGVLWDGDPRIAVPLIERLRADGRWCVGDNEPYSGRGTLGGTVETHATPAGLPNVLLEIRQDLIATPQGAAEWADVIGDALDAVLAADPDIFTVRVYPREARE